MADNNPKPLTTFKRGVAKARREWQAGHYERALADVTHLLEEWPDNPQLLVMWADLIQLQEDEGEPTLEDAKAAYQRAAELDDQAPAPVIELGHFQYALEDDSRAASRTFERAAALCRRLLTEALIGRAKALLELDRGSEALACLAEAYAMRSGSSKPANGMDTDDILAQLREVARAE